MLRPKLLFLIFPIFINNFSLAVDPIIELPNGKVQGFETTTFANTTFYSFYKIPYATPPIGELRLKAPQPAQNWTDILNATKLDIVCHQLKYNLLNVTESEDCLFINIFTPQLPENDQSPSLPVMFFIHGGQFMSGSGNYPPDLFIDNGVILVTINYRLGVFGFLSSQDEIITGNNGLKDQRLALEWTYNNIQLFGGDPDQITIFGQGSGAASVAYQLFDQNAQGLFQAAILESGVSISPWALQRRPRRTAFDIATILERTFSTSNDSQRLLNFLQGIDAEDFNEAARQHLTTVVHPWEFDTSQFAIYGPVIEIKNQDAFLTRKMYPLIRAGNFLRVPILLGFNSEENLYYNQDTQELRQKLFAYDYEINLVVPNDMQIEDREELLEMGEEIRSIYTDGDTFENSSTAAIKYSSDTSFTRSIIRFAELISQYTETYFYQFSYNGKLGKQSGISIYYDGAESVGHTEELYYLFCSGTECDLSEFPENDQIISKQMIKIWTDFAKFQNPTPENSDLLQNLEWPELSVEDGDFFYVDIGENLEIKNHPKEESYQKWVELYDSLNVTDFDTY